MTRPLRYWQETKPCDRGAGRAQAPRAACSPFPRDYNAGLAPGDRARFARRWTEGASGAALQSDFGLTPDQVSYWRQVLALPPRRKRRPRWKCR